MMFRGNFKNLRSKAFRYTYQGIPFEESKEKSTPAVSQDEEITPRMPPRFFPIQRNTPVVLGHTEV